jgi:uncharacterized protein DUF3105
MSWRAALLPAGLLTFLFIGALALVFATRSGQAASADESSPPNSLHALAAKAGCRVIEVDLARPTNPPITGSFRESDRVTDADYSRSPAPPLKATLHAMLHGRVLFQYKPGLRPSAVAAMRRLYTEDSEKVLLFQNHTGMRYEAAATAYLSAIVCPRLTSEGLTAFRAFRDRRRAFAQLP